MINFKNGNILHVLVAFATMYISTEVQAQTTLVNEGHWDGLRIQLSQMIGELRQKCEIRGKSLPAVRKDEIEALEGCVHPEFNKLVNDLNSYNADERTEAQNAITQFRNGNSLEPNQIDSLTKSLAAPICHFVPAMIKCIKPHIITFRELCAPDTVEVSKTLFEYVDVMVKSTCKNGGRRVVEILATGGMYCSESVSSHSIECLTNSKLLSENNNVVTTPEMCKSLGAVHDCLDSSLNTCEKKQPTTISKSILEEVRPWLSTSCLTSGSAQNYGGLIAMIICTCHLVFSRVLFM